MFRRLQQDVGLFWRTMRDMAAQLRASGWELCRRRARGAPGRALAQRRAGRPRSRRRRPGFGGGELRQQLLQVRLGQREVAVVKDDGTPFDDPFPIAKADPLGFDVSAGGAHPQGQRARLGLRHGRRRRDLRRRLLRIGIPFGTFLDGKQKYQDHSRSKNDRGLLFLSIQASIEDQFEFLQTGWMNDDARPKMPGGNDMIVGQNAPAAGGRAPLHAVRAGAPGHEVSAPRKWVIPTGGGYFFLPSLSALREVLT